MEDHLDSASCKARVTAFELKDKGFEPLPTAFALSCEEYELPILKMRVPYNLGDFDFKWNQRNFESTYRAHAPQKKVVATYFAPSWLADLVYAFIPLTQRILWPEPQQLGAPTYFRQYSIELVAGLLKRAASDEQFRTELTAMLRLVDDETHILDLAEQGKL